MEQIKLIKMKVILKKYKNNFKHFLRFLFYAQHKTIRQFFL